MMKAQSKKVRCERMQEEFEDFYNQCRPLLEYAPTYFQVIKDIMDEQRYYLQVFKNNNDDEMVYTILRTVQSEIKTVNDYQLLMEIKRTDNDWIVYQLHQIMFGLMDLKIFINNAKEIYPDEC